MKKRHILILILFTLFGCESKKDEHSSGNDQSHPNVLFIAIDDLNDYVSLLQNYPGVQTPNLDKFSTEAITFTRAYCAGPICNPSRTSILTGLAPHITGVYENNDHWIKSEQAVNATALPEAFKEAGYTTLWAGKLFHDLSAPSKDRLEKMWDDTGTNVPGELWNGSTNLVPYGPSTPLGYGALEPDSIFADVTNVELANEWLSAEYDNPFFMAVGIIRPHRPWTAPKRFFDRYPMDELTLPPGYVENDLEDIPSLGIEIAKNRGVDMDKMKELGRWKAAVQAYLACVSFADESIGKLLEALKNSRYRDNTIVVLWGDHGYHMGEKDHMGKWTLWEQSTRNLLMISTPDGVQAGVKYDQPVSLLDMYPTLVEMCRLPKVSQALSGSSLVPILEDQKHNRKTPVLTTYPYNSHSLRDAKFRYIRYSDGGEELYDHEVDPREWDNLALSPDYQVELERFRQFVPKENKPSVGPVPELEVWQAERRRLKSSEKKFGKITE